MAVEKRNGKWYIRGKLKKEDGTYYEYRRLAKDCRKKSEAEAYELKFREQYQQENVIHIKGVKTFREVAEEMLENSTSVKYSTILTDRDLLKKADGAIGGKPINLITAPTLQRLVNDLEDQYSERYVKNIYYAVNKVFKHAIFKGYIKTNPMEKVKRKINKDEVKKEMLFWEPADFQIFIANVDDIEMRAFFIFSFWMGTRRGETLALQWKDIDWKSRSVRINKTVTQRAKDAHWAITAPKRKNSVRVIMMPQTVINVLRELYDKQKVMHAFDDDVYLFGYYRPMGLDKPRRYLKQIIRRVNDSGQSLPDIRVHDLRHSHASYLINTMSDQFTIYDIAKRIGDTVDTVLETYAHWFRDADKKVVNAIDKGLGSEEKHAPISYIEELKGLKELLDIGAINDEEYETKKRQLLGLGG